MSDDLLFIIDHPIIHKSIKCIDQLDNSSHHVFDLNTSRIGRLMVDWSVQNMNPDTTLYSMFLDVSVSQKK